MEPKPQRLTYVHLQADLRRRIAQGEWTAGTLLPGRREMAASYGVALNTMQRAMAALTEEGVLVSRDGRGTFVAAREVPDARPAVRLTNAAAPQAQIGLVVPFGRPEDPPARHDESSWRQMSRPDSGFGIGRQWNEEILRGAEAEAGRHGMSTRCYPVLARQDGFAGVLPATYAALAAGVDALVWVNFHDNYRNYSPEVFAALRGIARPVIYVGVTPVPLHLPEVIYDQTMAGRQAADHLLTRGYRRLVTLRPFVSPWLDARLQGLRTVAQAPLSGASYRELAEQPLPYEVFRDLPDARRQALVEALLAPLPQELAAPDNRPLALAAPSDDIAGQAVHWLAARDLAPGRDLGLLGFDDTPDARAGQLTSIRPPCEELGRQALRLALQALRGESVTLEVRIAGTLVCRSSTRSCRAPALAPTPA